MAHYNRSAEHREWPRLPLAIPLFVRSQDRHGKTFLEFATALNISASGALVAVRRAHRVAMKVLLEIPSVPVATVPVPKSSRNLRATIVRIAYANGHYLLGVKFSQPLLKSRNHKTSVVTRKTSDAH